MVKMKVEKTKKGYPAMWESGGGLSNTGYAKLIASSDGSPKRPVYIRRRGSLACDDHALFIVEIGDLVIEASHHRYDFEISVYRIEAIDNEEAKLSPIHEFSCGEWDVEPLPSIMEAVEAAKSKATDYHCRVPYWFIPDQN
jgi:hypothetical protein